MSDLDRIRRELQEEEARFADVVLEEDDPAFDSDLAAAFEGIEPSDTFIDAFFELPGSADRTPAASVASVIEAVSVGSPEIDLAVLRQAHGLSKDAAARILDVNVPALDRLEAKLGLNWLNIAADKVRTYLGRLEVNPTVFVRGIANQMPIGPSPVYGYRPRMIVEEHLEVEDSEADRTRLIAWGHELYGQDNV